MIKPDRAIEKCKEVHGDKYDYSLVEYKKVTDVVKIICPIHGIFEQTIRQHYRGQGCPLCGIKKRSESKKYDTETFIKKSKEIFGDKYNYDKVKYINSVTPVTITCKKHGDFLLKPNYHLSGRGCPMCGNERKGENKRITKDEFILRSKEIHGDKYDYSLVEYKNGNTPVKIICPIHGVFGQKPNEHLQKHGCPICGIKKRSETFILSQDEFINRAKEKHGDKYDYNESEYVKGNIPVKIICPTHGTFYQKPYYHLSGCGCRKCKSITSQYENEMISFIESIVGPEKLIRNDRKLLDGFEVDAYIPSKNVAFEFDGLYWHCEINKPDKNYHLNKTIECEKKGVQLIHIFEDEWVDKQEICKSRIKNILGVTENKVYGRKCSIEIIDFNKSKEFFDTNHIQGSVRCSVTIGLKYNNEYVAMMSFGKARKNLGRTAVNDEYEMLRFCNKLNYSVIGGASKIMKYFINNYHPKKIISYADKRWSNGNLYERIGFNFIHNSSPSYFYIVGNKRKNRFAFRKDILVSKYGCSKNDTEHNFCLNNGLYRIYDCGTKLYEVRF